MELNAKQFTMAIASLIVGIVLIVGILTPICAEASKSSETVENEGAGWVRFALDRNADTTYTLSYTDDENGVYIDNGTDRQTYDDSSTTDFETILYADSNLSVWDDGTMKHILGTNEGNPVYLEGSGALTIVRDADGVTVTPEGEEPLTFGVPTWAYIPLSTGNYGFFAYDEERGVENYPSDMPLAVVGGGFAGVYAYNDIYRYNGLGLSMQSITDEDGLFYGGSWSKTDAADTQSLNTDDSLDPSAINLDPSMIQPIDDPFNSGMGLMAVPAPTYTDGVWGYDRITIDGETKAAIVSYSGTGGDIVVPATVGGYDVYRFGKSAPNVEFPYNIFDNTTLSAGSTLTISDGIVEIGSGALQSASNLTGSLVIPDSVTSIGSSAFYGCSGFTGSLVIPGSITSLPNYLFSGCSGLTGSLTIPDSVTSIGNGTFQSCRFTGSLIIPESITSIGSSAFDNTRFDDLIIVSDFIPSSNVFSMNTLTEALDLSDTVDYSVDRYGIPANATVSDSIGDCFGFISVVEYTTGGDSTPTQMLIAVLPLLMVVGLIVGCIGFLRIRS